MLASVDTKVQTTSAYASQPLMQSRPTGSPLIAAGCEHLVAWMAGNQHPAANGPSLGPGLGSVSPATTKEGVL